jgi:riboflavin synthase
MFTGLIMDVGRLVAIEWNENGARVRIETNLDVAQLGEGASVAVNGVCLTVKSPLDGSFEADLSGETLHRTTFQNLSAGARVNIEPALCLGDPLGGHMVQGHVDGLGELIAIEEMGEFCELTWRLDRDRMAEVVEKGSIAIDGISLTIAALGDESITAAIVPHTQDHTNLAHAQVGDAVNVETDILGKYVRRTLHLGT